LKLLLEENSIRVIWQELFLSIDLSDFAPNYGHLLAIKESNIYCVGANQFQLKIRLRCSLPGIESNTISIPCSSIECACESLIKCLGLVSVLSQLERSEIDSVILEQFCVRVSLPCLQGLVIHSVTKGKRSFGPAKVPYFLKFSVDLTSPSTAVMDILDRCNKEGANIKLSKLLISIQMWMQTEQCITDLRSAEGTPDSKFPAFILKSIFFGSLYLTPTIFFHLRILPERICIAITSRGFSELGTLVGSLQSARKARKWQYFSHLPRMAILSVSKDASLIPEFFKSLQVQYQKGRLLMEAHSHLVETGRALNLREVFLDGTSLRFHCNGFMLEMSVTRLTTSAVVDTPSRKVPNNCKLSESERKLLSRLLSLPLSPILEDQSKPNPTLLCSVIDALLIILGLPMPVLRVISQCASLSHRVTLLLISPPISELPYYLRQSLPAYPRPCVYAFPGNSGSSMNCVSLVFRIAYGDAGNLFKFIPLTYSWDANVVSPWDASATQTAMAAGVELNPSMVLAMLAANKNQSQMGKTVIDILNELKSDGLTGPSKENRLVWTIDQLLKFDLEQLI
jgi:hypothetical protein